MPYLHGLIRRCGRWHRLRFCRPPSLRFGCS
nr:MAG TPA: hypothetical protein [Caudoviricetes sp.]